MGNRTISANTRKQTGRHRSNTWRYLPSIACQICILSIFTIPYIQHPFQWAGSALLVSRNEFLRLQMDVHRDACRIPRGCAGKKRLRTDCFDRKLAGNRFTSVERLRVFHFFSKTLCVFFRWLVRKYSKRWKVPDPPVLACPNALNASATCSCKKMNHFRDPCSIFLLFSAEVPARRIYKIAV